MSQTPAIHRRSFLEALSQRVLVFDGAMGTNIHRYDPTDTDWGGKELANCTDWMTLTRPEWIFDIHSHFLKVGCDAVETNTFGANRIALNEFGKADYTYEINKKATEIAKEACKALSTPTKPRFISCGRVGKAGPAPTKVLLTKWHSRTSVRAASISQGK